MHNNTYSVSMQNKVTDTKKKVQGYIYEALGAKVVIRLWNDSNRVPNFIRQAFDFFLAEVFGCKCLLMIKNENASLTPAAINNYFGVIKKNFNINPVYISETISSYDRKRLVGHKVSFIIPGNQMYLPYAGIDLREYFIGGSVGRDEDLFTPAAQAVLIFFLRYGSNNILSQKELADKTGYSAMTLSRVLREFESAGLGRIERVGRRKNLVIGLEKKDIWQKALPFMRSPVRSKIVVSQNILKKDYLVSGLNALSLYSNIAAPTYKTYALSPEEEEYIKETDRLNYLDEGDVILEIWKYSPHICAESGIVDKYSLYLSLQEEKDERISVALDKMTKAFKW